jgi:hypothetical protein
MISAARLLPLAALAMACASLPALGTDIVACVVATNAANNATYYGAATTVTQLKCEFTNKDYFPTLPELYRQGWRLIQVLGGDQAILKGGQGVSPLYLLEREGNAPAAAAAPPAAPAAAHPEPKKK